MSDNEPSANPNEPNRSQAIVNADEVSLEDIDKLLEEDDPGFSTSLTEVRDAAEATDIEIESIAIDEESLGEDQSALEATGFLSKVPALKYLLPLFLALGRLKIRTKNWLILLGREFWTWTKVRPKEYVSYIFVTIKNLFRFVGSQIANFKALPVGKKLIFLSFLIVLVGGLTVISLNLKGRWLPVIDKPLIKDFSEVSSQTWGIKNEKWVPLFQALRQPEHRYLFDKVVVNLKRVDGPAETNPMGLFEFYVELDSKETAIEVNSRRLELLDLLQRTIEGETYSSLVGEAGKQRLKNLIRQELNEVIHHGWVKDVYISNMVLKP